MRNVKVMNIPVGVLAAGILALGYALWGVEAAMAAAPVQKLPCSIVEISAPAYPVATNS